MSGFWVSKMFILRIIVFKNGFIKTKLYVLLDIDIV